MTLIRRNNIIPGATNDNYHVSGEEHCLFGTLPGTVTRTLDADAVHNLHTTPFAVVSNQNNRVVPIGVYYSKATGAYTGGSAVTVSYSGGKVIATIPVTALRNAAAVTGWATRAQQSGTPETYEVPRGGVEVKAATAFAGAGGDLEVQLLMVEAE